MCNDASRRLGRIDGRDGKHTNTEFELRGFNDLALVCRDMAETVAWYEDKLGMKLVEDARAPGRLGQHFFLDMGNGVDGFAFFWFPDAPEGVRGESLQICRGVTAIGTHEPRRCSMPPLSTSTSTCQKLRRQGSEGHRDHQPRELLDGGHRPDYRRGADDGDVFIRSMYFKTRTARRSSSPVGRKCSTRARSANCSATTRTTVDA